MSSKIPVYVAAVEHEYGVNIDVSLTVEGANKAVDDFVATWWDTGTMGDIAEEGAIDRYFQESEQESYIVDEAELDLKGLKVATIMFFDHMTGVVDEAFLGKVKTYPAASLGEALLKLSKSYPGDLYLQYSRLYQAKDGESYWIGTILLSEME